MTHPTTSATLVDDTFIEEAVDALLADMDMAQVNMQTTRGVAGADYNDPGMRDFTATLTLYVSFADLDEDDLPDWYSEPTWADVPHEEVMAVLGKVNPLLPVLALKASPDSEGALVHLVAIEGSLMNPYTMVGSTYDALDARSAQHEALYPAVNGENDYGVGLHDELERLVEGVGNVVLLTNIDSSPAWNLLSAGLEGGLTSIVLQDVAAGSCAVLLHTGSMVDMPYTERHYLRDFLRSASFEQWDHGIWYASTAFQDFHDPADDAVQLFG